MKIFNFARNSYINLLLHLQNGLNIGGSVTGTTENLNGSFAEACQSADEDSVDAGCFEGEEPTEEEVALAMRLNTTSDSSTKDTCYRFFFLLTVGFDLTPLERSDFTGRRFLCRRGSQPGVHRGF